MAKSPQSALTAVQHTDPTRLGGRRPRARSVRPSACPRTDGICGATRMPWMQCGMKGAASVRPPRRRLRDAQTTLRSRCLCRAEALRRAAPPAALRGGSGVSGLRAQSMYQKIEEKLKAGLKPVKLTIVDNSHQHAGHAGVNGRESVPAPALAASALPASQTISPLSERSLSDDPMVCVCVCARARTHLLVPSAAARRTLQSTLSAR